MNDDPYYRELPDGTIKQVNPFTGTKVWTVPGRGARPLGKPAEQTRELADHDRRAACVFCPDNYLSTPPEKTRLVKRAGGLVRGHDLIRCVPADRLDATVPEFRRVPNLFEILSWRYWQLNWGMSLPRAARDWQEEYLSNPSGEAHVRSVLNAKFKAVGSDRRAEDLGPQNYARLPQPSLPADMTSSSLVAITPMRARQPPTLLDRRVFPSTSIGRSWR